MTDDAGWEARMAAKAAARRPAVKERDDYEQWRRSPEVAASNEAAIQRAVEQQRDLPEDEYVCACVGPPTGCSLCHCHIREAARARLERRACRWCSGQPRQLGVNEHAP